MAKRSDRDRQRNRMFSIQCIHADCAEIRLQDKYKEPKQQFDICSAQFSMHYGFDSEQRARKMVQNACECLRPGGYFVGTLPDANRLVHKLRESPSTSYGNEVYKVNFASNYEDGFPLFGARYDFSLHEVVDCPEFLVHFPLLEKIASEFDMVPVFRKTFPEFVEHFKDQYHAKQLLHQIQALEPYPPVPGSEAASSESSQYGAAASVVEENEAKGQSIQTGTMTKDEWEVACLYLAFAFQKRPISSSKRPHGDGETESETRPKVPHHD